MQDSSTVQDPAPGVGCVTEHVHRPPVDWGGGGCMRHLKVVSRNIGRSSNSPSAENKKPNRGWMLPVSHPHTHDQRYLNATNAI